MFMSPCPQRASQSVFARTAVAATLMPTPTPTTTFSASVITTLQPSLFASTWKRELLFCIVLCFEIHPIAFSSEREERGGIVLKTSAIVYHKIHNLVSSATLPQLLVYSYHKLNL